jgi:hypothetical protein
MTPVNRKNINKWFKIIAIFMSLDFLTTNIALVVSNYNYMLEQNLIVRALMSTGNIFVWTSYFFVGLFAMYGILQLIDLRILYVIIVGIYVMTLTTNIFSILSLMKVIS